MCVWGCVGVVWCGVYVCVRMHSHKCVDAHRCGAQVAVTEQFSGVHLPLLPCILGIKLRCSGLHSKCFSQLSHHSGPLACVRESTLLCGLYVSYALPQILHLNGHKLRSICNQKQISQGHTESRELTNCIRALQ